MEGRQELTGDHLGTSCASLQSSCYWPVWMVPQVFNWAAYKKSENEKAEQRQPSIDEVRSVTWQCLAEGAANGLVAGLPALRRAAL